MEKIVKFGFILCFWLTFGALGSGCPACLWDQWMVAARPWMICLTGFWGVFWFAFMAGRYWSGKKVRFWRYFFGFGVVYLLFLMHVMAFFIRKDPLPNPPYISRLETEEMRDHFILRWMLQYPCIDEHGRRLYFDTTNNMMLAILDPGYDLDLTAGVPSWEDCRLRKPNGELVRFSPQKNQALIFQNGTFRQIAIPPVVVTGEIYDDFSEHRSIPELVNVQLRKWNVADGDLNERR